MYRVKKEMAVPQRLTSRRSQVRFVKRLMHVIVNTPIA